MKIYLAKYIFSHLTEIKLFAFNAVKRGPMPDLSPERGEWGSAEPEGPPLAKEKQLKKVARIRQEFAEAWLWTETELKYMKKNTQTSSIALLHTKITEEVFHKQQSRNN